MSSFDKKPNSCFNELLVQSICQKMLGTYLSEVYSFFVHNLCIIHIFGYVDIKVE